MFSELLLLTCGALFAQQPSVAKPGIPQHERRIDKQTSKAPTFSGQWLERARLFTAELERDIPELSTSEAAIVNARLARAWWKLDPTQSRQWLDRAIELVTHVPDNEPWDERRRRLEAGTEVLSIATPIVNSEEAKRINAQLTKGEEADNSKYREQMALVKAVFDEVQRGDPKVAARLMSEALKSGSGIIDSEMIMMLRDHNEDLANGVFREALVAFEANNYDPQTLAALIGDAFHDPPMQDVKGAPEELRSALLLAAKQAVLRVPHDSSDQRSICVAAQEVTPLLGKFPADQLAALQAAVDGCSANFPEIARQYNPKPDVDCTKVGSQECVRLAETEPDANHRKFLRTNAMLTAAEIEKNPELALRIYNGLDDDDRRDLSDFELMEIYEPLGTKYLEASDRGSFYDLLRESPDSLRPRLQLSFAEDMLQKERTPEALALLSDARATLSKTGTEYPDLYLQLLKLYPHYLPIEAPAVVREVIEGLNGLRAEKTIELQGLKGSTSITRRMRPLGLSPALMDLDTTFLSESADALQSPPIRACFRFGLVQAALRRDQMEGEQRKKLPRPASVSK